MKGDLYVCGLKVQHYSETPHRKPRFASWSSRLDGSDAP